MSYTVDIVQGPVPSADKEAWAALEVWREELYAAKVGEVSPEMRALHDKLLSRFPSITVDEAGPWSDGPLINDFGKRMVILGVVYSRVEEVIPFVLETSLAMGFARDRHRALGETCAPGGSSGAQNELSSRVAPDRARRCGLQVKPGVRRA